MRCCTTGQQYEGLESSPNIYYTGATTNQQIIPSLDYLRDQGVKSLYLVGSDYVFPRTSNAIVKAYAEANGIEIKGEDYAPLGSTDFSTIVNKIRAARCRRGVQRRGRRLADLASSANTTARASPRQAMPVMSMCVGEEEVEHRRRHAGRPAVVVELLPDAGHPGQHQRSSRISRPSFGADRVTSDPMESAYTAVKLWKAAWRRPIRSPSPTSRALPAASASTHPKAPITIDGENHHVTKTARIGTVDPDGLIDQVWESPAADQPGPVPEELSLGRGNHG